MKLTHIIFTIFITKPLIISKNNISFGLFLFIFRKLLNDDEPQLTLVYLFPTFCLDILPIIKPQTTNTETGYGSLLIIILLQPTRCRQCYKKNRLPAPLFKMKLISYQYFPILPIYTVLQMRILLFLNFFITLALVK